MTKKQISRCAQHVIELEEKLRNPETKEDAAKEMDTYLSMLLALPDGFEIMSQIDEKVQKHFDNKEKI